ncbi:MAG: RluA family pseudouridine synthase, partial [Oscillospiraceae bacterium]
MSERGRSLSFTVSGEENGSTVGDVLRRRGVSRRLTVKLKRAENGITLNGEHIRTVDTVKSGDIISLLLR